MILHIKPQAMRIGMPLPKKDGFIAYNVRICIKEEMAEFLNDINATAKFKGYDISIETEMIFKPKELTTSLVLDITNDTLDVELSEDDALMYKLMFGDL